MEECQRQLWLLRDGVVSTELREAHATLVVWLANTSLPWATYRALMRGRLISLDKQPRVRPVGVGDMAHRLLAKAVLKMAGEEETNACEEAQLCGGLVSGI